MEPKERQERKQEHGAIIVEATLALSLFMFAMFTFLSIIQVAYVQSRMTVSLACATKEVAEYAHLFFAAGLNETFSGEGGGSSEVINGVADFISEIGGHLGSVSSELGQYVTDAGDALSGDSLADIGKGLLGQQLVLQMMEKNLVSETDDNAEAWLRRNRVTDVTLMESKFLEGNTTDIFMRVKYKVHIIKLLDIDFSYQMSSVAYTKAWGNVKEAEDGVGG